MASLPRMESYLADLPDGVDSYPDHVQKASVYRQVLAQTDLRDLAGHLPRPVAQLVFEPLPASVWVPEVHLKTLYTAICDYLFETEDTYLAHWREVSRSLLTSPLYRVLMIVASPGRVVKGASTRWGALHRGMTLKAEPGEDGRSAAFRLDYPPALLPPVSAKVYGLSFAAALEASGGKDVRVEMTRHGRTETRYEAAWS